LPFEAAGDEVLVEAAGDFSSCDELQAPTDSVVAVATARIANLDSQACSKVGCIEVLSLVGRVGQIS
jgi:hypothetical protein